MSDSLTSVMSLIQARTISDCYDLVETFHQLSLEVYSDEDMKEVLSHYEDEAIPDFVSHLESNSPNKIAEALLRITERIKAIVLQNLANSEFTERALFLMYLIHSSVVQVLFSRIELLKDTVVPLHLETLHWYANYHVIVWYSERSFSESSLIRHHKFKDFDKIRNHLKSLKSRQNAKTSAKSKSKPVNNKSSPPPIKTIENPASSTLTLVSEPQLIKTFAQAITQPTPVSQLSHREIEEIMQEVRAATLPEGTPIGALTENELQLVSDYDRDVYQRWILSHPEHQPKDSQEATPSPQEEKEEQTDLPESAATYSSLIDLYNPSDVKPDTIRSQQETIIQSPESPRTKEDPPSDDYESDQDASNHSQASESENLNLLSELPGHQSAEEPTPSLHRANAQKKRRRRAPATKSTSSETKTRHKHDKKSSSSSQGASSIMSTFFGKRR